MMRALITKTLFVLSILLSAQAMAHYNCAALGLQCFSDTPLLQFQSSRSLSL